MDRERLQVSTRFVTNFGKVREFHETFNVPNAPKPTLSTKEIQDLRVELIDEEFKELKDALEAGDIVEVADALTDILYVVYGAGLAFGIPLDECFEEVQRSNMSKLGEDGKPIYREDGKVLKGPNYFRPNLKRIIDEASG
jgi:predicted HAD superfamily Cof-like phosphohydrolase